MTKVEDTWRDRHGLVAEAYGLNVIHMLTVKTVAHGEYLKLSSGRQKEVEKLIKKYQWKTSKEGIASVVEAICNVLNPNHEISLLNGVLDGCCYNNNLYDYFGLNHVFSVIFLPILVSTITGQENYGVNIKGYFDAGWGEMHSLFQILEIHHEILRWHETNGETEVYPIYRFGNEFVEKATIKTNDINAVEYTIARYHDVQLNYGRV